MIENILQYFNWTALIMSSLLVALTVTVVNQTSKGQEMHNASIAFASAIFFSVLLTDWTNFMTLWQPITLQFSLTILVACFFGFSRRQEIVDNFITGLMTKANLKKAATESETTKKESQ